MLHLRITELKSLFLTFQCFGNLFFLLQTEPKYIAKLTRSVDTTEIDELLQIVMFSLYGNQYGEREEHLLLKMFEVGEERVSQASYLLKSPKL